MIMFKSNIDHQRSINVPINQNSTIYNNKMYVYDCSFYHIS